jgi:hypothetical protein
MKHIFLYLCLFSSLTLSAQTLEKWTLTDGRSFEGQVKSVTPGMVTFARTTGPDAPLEISKLSAASQRRLIEVLGLSSPPAASAPAPVAAAAPTAPAATTTATPMNAAARNPGAIDATDIAVLDSKFGMRSIVIGKVSRITSLGSTGHKKINFEGSEFYLFINKRVIEANPTWKADDLKGQLVQVEGEIGKYQDQIQIQIADLAQISTVTP